MKMRKRTFRIGQLAQHLKVERFVVRFWEKEFGVKSHRSPGGQRFYDQKDLEKFQRIKELLYDKGFTIAGAKKVFSVKQSSDTPIIASKKTTLDSSPEIEKLTEHIVDLQKKLLKLRELL